MYIYLHIFLLVLECIKKHIITHISRKKCIFLHSYRKKIKSMADKLNESVSIKFTYFVSVNLQYIQKIKNRHNLYFSLLYLI